MGEMRAAPRGAPIDGWDPQDNIAETKTIGDSEFTVHHFKGTPGFWATGGPDAGKFIHYGSEYTEYWTVSLPHQCDEWEIVPYDFHAPAVAALEKFIAEAQQALEALRGMRP